MPEQTVLFTPVPDGVFVPEGAPANSMWVRLRVHVGPRLLASGKLGDFAEWVDWPAMVAQLDPWEVHFPSLGRTFEGHLATDVVARSDVWTRLFPDGTPVDARKMPMLTKRLLHSYSTETVSKFLTERWGRFGAESPGQYPAFADLLDDDGFGPIAFERLKRDVHMTGPARRQTLLGAHLAQFDRSSADPDKWAIEHLDLPPDPDDRRDEIARRFLELEHFHVRGRRGSQKDTLAEQPDQPSFHELVAMVQRYPTLMRVLGLVLVVEAEIPGGITGPQAGTPVQATCTALPAVQRPVWARTMCAVNPSMFRVIPNPAGDQDLVGRQLKLGDARFRVDTVDHDTGAMRAMQFADNVARSHPDLIDDMLPSSAYTADEFAMPAQATGGITVSRVNRANRLAHLLDKVQNTNNSIYDIASGLPFDPPIPPLFWADDITRGFRWDIKSDSDGHWRSLMEMQGRYDVGNPGEVIEVAAVEEGISSAGLTSAGGAQPGDDLYAHESLMHWGGWSLAVRPPGATVGRDDGVADPDVPVAPDGTTPGPLAPIKAQFAATPGSLPRLRFGETYRVRARAVDITGTGDDLPAATEPGAESPGVDYLRFEPVSAPIAALRDPAVIPGETNTVVVIRSEDAKDSTLGKNHRHILPPRTNISVAERHGRLDTDQAGHPLDLQALANLGQRDAQDLSMHPAIQPAGGGGPTEARWFPVDELDVNYLPDPLAKRALVRDLPPGPGGATDVNLEMLAAPWPELKAGGIRIVSSDVTGWQLTGNQLIVSLGKGEDRFVRVSSRFDEADADLMGVWPWIVEWIATHGGNVDQVHADVKAGRHWMFTPWQTLRLVHAVRTPLLVPTLPDPGFSAVKDGVFPAATFANVRWKGDYSRKSTGQLDLVSDWEMKVDNGPGTGPDPTQPQSFTAVAATFPLDHRSSGGDAADFQARHEFGDTKYRSVDYHAVATSAFTEFFREHADVVVPGMDVNNKPLPIPVDSRGLEAPTVVVRYQDVELRQGPAADYTVDEDNGALLRGPNSSIVTGAVLDVSYVAPAIHTESEIRTRSIKSSARPAAPKVEYVVPTFEWQRSGNTSSRKGNALRVYLKRPWWSSGDDERLGVVLWRKPAGELDPPDAIKPYVTMWGLDPVFNAPGVATTPVLSSFPLAVEPVSNVRLAERDVMVDVAAHEVHFDSTRDLWYADIKLDFGGQNKGYFPFVRLALCRYQPHSLTGVEISSIVLADYAQVAPDRTVSVAGSGMTRTVTVAGRAYSANSSANEASRMMVTVERERDDVSVDDPNLKWQQTGSPVALGRSISDTNLVTWSGTVQIPSVQGLKRLVVEELELHKVGTPYEAINGPAGRRLVFTDIVDL